MVATSKVPAKRALDIEPTPLDTARSVLMSDFSLRPRGPKPVPESYISQKNRRPQKQQLDLNTSRPSTPERNVQHPTSQDTVSPPSKPRGMGILID
jgi:hypothetical protein